MKNGKKLTLIFGFYLFVAVFPVQAQSSISHIQSKISNSSTYVSSQSITLDSSVASGDLIVVAVSAYTGTNADILSVTDSKGNTYIRAVRNPAIANSQHHIGIWYANNVVGGEGFTITVTPASNSYVSVAAHEYKNAAIDSVLDGTAGNSGSTTSASSNTTAPTTQGNELIFGAFMHQAASNPSTTPGAGFTLRQSLTNGTFEPIITEDKVVSSSGAYSANLTWAPSVSWRGVVATFKSANSAVPTPSITGILPHTPVPTATATPTPTPTTAPSPALSQGPTQTLVPTAPPGILETFEGDPNSWHLPRDTSGSGSVLQSGNFFYSGNNSARTNTISGNSSAFIRSAFSEPASSHAWQERPGTFNWQHIRMFIPSSTIAQLSGNEYITLGGMWASSGGHAWYLRAKENGQLFIVGTKSDGSPVEFNTFATIPTDQWFDLEIGLHSQNGPGVKRAFAIVLNGHFYGWFRQGRMDSENYDRIAYGILDTNSADNLEVYLDDWYTRTTGVNPSGPDLRSSEPLQTHNFQDGSGENVQLDWSTWQNDVRLTNEAGIYSNTDRVQAGHNLDKMPDLTNGWEEIEIGWNGTPPPKPNSYFGPMVAFHKEINREENLEIIPIGNGTGGVDLVFEAWTNGAPTVMARWPLPEASFGGGSHIPEPGDIIRTKWRMVDPSNINIQASFFDASTNQWHVDGINGTYNISNLSGVNLNDGYHKASSITIDTSFYSIRRYQVGTNETYNYPNGASLTPGISQTLSPTATATPDVTPSPTPSSGAPTQSLTRSISAAIDNVNQDGSSLTASSSAIWLGNASSVSSSYTGLRFTNITIPQNAVITGAYLKFYSAQSQWLTINLNISAEATANSGGFSSDMLPSSKSVTVASVNHASNTNWNTNGWYSLDDIKTVVQEIVSRPDWASGNSIGIILKGTGSSSWGRKFVQSYDGSAANAPQLVITYK